MGMLERKHTAMSVAKLMALHEKKALDLSPAFQRDSVWLVRDRKSLIDSVCRNYPLPAIFLYKTGSGRNVRYAVIDGKQRLETLLGFVGQLRGKSFEVRLPIGKEGEPQLVSSKSMRHEHAAFKKHLLRYEIPVIEVTGSLSEVMHVFVRINSTGKALTSQEKRKARHADSVLLAAATKLASRLESIWTDGIISDQLHSRMRHVELAAELLLSVEGPINKKAAVDSAMTNAGLTAAKVARASNEVQSAVKRIKKMFPDLHTTRFTKLVDYYTLVVLVMRLQREGAILDDRKRNDVAWELLKAFGVQVDQIRQDQRKLRASSKPALAKEYLLSVSQMTDDRKQRILRERIMEQAIGSVFAKKDDKRGFSGEQRRILWNTSAEKCCAACGQALSWSNFTIDHVKPHSKGGRSTLRNADLMCRPCNSRKGNRRKLRHGRADAKVGHARARNASKSKTRRA
ncbi:DUF262 domain-containing protein [Lysobacter sp. 2RAF19]